MSGEANQTGGGAALEGLQAALRDVDDLPVAERVDTFEQVNDGIARELARLDEV